MTPSHSPGTHSLFQFWITVIAVLAMVLLMFFS